MKLHVLIGFKNSLDNSSLDRIAEIATVQGLHEKGGSVPEFGETIDQKSQPLLFLPPRGAGNRSSPIGRRAVGAANAPPMLNSVSIVMQTSVGDIQLSSWRKTCSQCISE